MKRTIAAVLCAAMLLLLAGCGKGNTSNVKIDYGTSSVYSQKEMDAAIDVIKKQFRSFAGCELHSLSYMSDEECNDTNSSFRSPKDGGGAWEADQEYTWSWWLARSEGGQWKLMTWGYC